MNLYLVRHGETAHNRDGLGLGRDDVPLTDLGQAQAGAIAQRLAEVPVERVLTSPLRRAADVAAAIAMRHELAPETEDALIELDVGEADGLPFAEVRERYGDLMEAWRGPEGHTVAMPGGESVTDVEDRIVPFLDQLRTGGEDHVVLVTHNFVIRAMVAHLLGLGASHFRSFAVDLGSLSTVTAGKRSAVLQVLNDTCHLSHLYER